MVTGLYALGLAATLGLPPAIGGARDPRLEPIGRNALTVAVRQTGLRYPESEVLITRAVVSGLADTVDEEYARLWRSNPKNAWANLLRAEAALACLEKGPIVAGKPSPPTKESSDALFAVARVCLKKAVALDPRSAPAAREYGFFRWQYGDMKGGYAMIKAAERLDRNDPATHLVLGYVYLNQTSNVYDRDNARAELRAAIRLDPLYASPHRLLRGLYLDQHDQHKDEADREQREFRALVSEGAEVRTTWLNHH